MTAAPWSTVINLRRLTRHRDEEMHQPEAEYTVLTLLHGETEWEFTTYTHTPCAHIRKTDETTGKTFATAGDALAWLAGITGAGPAEEDEEPEQTPYERLLEEFSDIHGYGQMEPEAITEHFNMDPNQRYLLVEKNVRGGYWLTTSDNAEELLSHHFNQEYAEEWTVEALWDLLDDEELAFEMHFSFTTKEESEAVTP